MKKDLPNDGLERFLKKSFEGYEDTPKGDLWDKIAGDLDVPVGGLKETVPIYKTWWAGAAAALFAGVIAAQFLYFQNKIDNLTQAVDNQKVKVEKIDASKEKSNLNKWENPNPSNKNSDLKNPSGIVEIIEQNTPNTSINSEETQRPISNFEKVSEDVKSSTDASRNSEIVTAPTSKSPSTSNGSKTPRNKIKQVRNADKLPNSSLEGGDLSPLKNTDRLVIDDEKSEQIEQHLLDENLKNEVAKTTIEQLKTIDFLPFKNTKLPVAPNAFVFEKMPELFTPTAKIKPIRSKRKGTSIGIVGGIFSNTETVKGDIRKSFLPPPSNRNFLVDFQDDSSVGTTRIGGLNIKIDLTNNWSLIPGILYRKDIFKSENVFDFKFKKFNRPNPSMRTHEVEFLQHTIEGTTLVDIRVETSNGDMINDDEKVGITTQVTREKEYISFPVVLNYRLDRGDWHFNLGGGIVFNRLIRNNQKVEISDIRHPQIKRDHQYNIKNTIPHLRSSNLDGIFNVGIEYDLTDHFSILLNPTIMFDLTEKTRLPNVDSDLFSLGVDMGVNYNF